LGANEDVLAALVDCCGNISVSIATSQDEFVACRGPVSAYAATLERIEKLSALRARRGHPARLALNTTLRPGLALSSPAVTSFVAHWRARVDEIQVWMEMAYAEGIGHVHRAGLTRHQQRRRVCMQPFSFVAVLSDGTVCPCCVSSRVRLATVNARSGLAAALRQPEYCEFLARHSSLALEGTACTSCEAWLDDWLGDEEVPLGQTGITATLEGATARIEGKPAEASA
jgi:hypothetical protein